MSKKTYSCIIGVLLIAISIYIFAVSTTFPKADVAQGYGAGVYPQILAGILFLLSAIMIIDALRKKENKESVPGLTLHALKYPALFFSLILFFCFTFKYIGFLMAGFIYMLVATKLLFKAKWIPAIIASILAPVFVWLVFKVLMNIPLPAGAIWSVLHIIG